MEHSYAPVTAGPGNALTLRAAALLRSARHCVDAATAESEGWRGTPAFTVVRSGDRNTVLRARVPNGGHAGTSLVFKLPVGDAERADADLRCMLALTGTGVVPDVVAELSDARGFAMQDAGDCTLEWALARGGERGVRAAVAAMARAYARLHVAGRSQARHHEGLRSAARTRELGDWTDGLPRAFAWLHLADGDARVRRALTRIVAAWYADRDTLTLTHGDPAPGNVLLVGASGEARLVDFEYGAVRHPAYDLTAWDVLCPLPNDLVQHLRHAYVSERARLGWPVPAAHVGYEAILAYRALAMLAWFPPAARERDGDWVAPWTVRQAVLSTLDRLGERGADDPHLRGLAEAALTAAAHWRREWPEIVDVLPRWSSLRNAVA